MVAEGPNAMFMGAAAALAVVANGVLVVGAMDGPSLIVGVNASRKNMPGCCWICKYTEVYINM